MGKLDVAAVAKLLVELGRRTALLGGDSYFRSRAYMRAAERIAALTEPLGKIIEEGRLQQIPGIGTVIADVITALHCIGTHPLLERLRQDVPESVLDMLTIPGLKPEKIDILHRELGISTLKELETAAREDRLKSVKDWGPHCSARSCKVSKSARK
jgi:DNA polymerase (family 10)